MDLAFLIGNNHQNLSQYNEGKHGKPLAVGPLYKDILKSSMRFVEVH